MFDVNWLEQIFVGLLNMSLTGSIIILAVLACRLLLRGVPKIFSYVLWAVVLFRLLCPVSFTSTFSLLGALDSPAAELGRVTYISQEMFERETPEEISVPTASGEADWAQPMESMELGQGEPMESVEMGSEETQEFIEGRSEKSLEPESHPAIWAVFWAAGVLAMAVYGIFSLWRFSRQIEKAEHMNDNIWVSQKIETPFVYGLVRPRIYLPVGLGEEEKHYILLHEQIHIRRGDHIFRVLGFLALCLHWFNPFVWAAFFVSGKDMEMSCDEAVLRRVGGSVKKEYSESLLSLATGRRILGGAPLAFGEGDTGSRIKNVLRYKKPTAIFTGVVLVLIAVVAASLLANPAGNEEEGISDAVAAEGSASVDAAEGSISGVDVAAGSVSDEDTFGESMSDIPAIEGPRGKVAEGPDTLEAAMSLAGGQSREYIKWYQETPETAYAAEEWISGDGHLDFPFDRREDISEMSWAEQWVRYYIPVRALEQASTEELLRMAKEMLLPQYYHLYNMPSHFLGMMQSRFNIIDALLNRADFAQVLLAAYTADAYIPLIAVEQMDMDGGVREGEIVLEEIMLSGDALFDQLNEDERQQALTAVLEKEAARTSGAYYCHYETSSFFAHVYEQHEEGGSKWYDYIVEERKGGDTIRYLEDYTWSGWFMTPADYLQAGEADAVAREMYERYRLLDRLVFGGELNPGGEIDIVDGVTVSSTAEESTEYPGFFKVKHDTIQTMEQLRAEIESVCTPECAQEEFYRIIDSEPYPYREIDGLLYISIWDSPGILSGNVTIRGIMQRSSDSLQPEFVLNDTDSGEPIHCFMDLKKIDGQWYVDGISFEY